ncbi:hypothetical protein B7Y94_04675 [Candidatus Saccharibacteria bacterium 32-49-12]|nr:MAG: hypothetical protein B7Y94_04675 [Candidatus Saccharibacteria bacterium 32-49-12]
MNNQQPNKLVALAIVAGVILVITAIVLSIFSLNRSTITINTSPIQVDVSINGKKHLAKDSGSSYGVSGDEVELIISREGFLDHKLTHTISKEEEKNTIYVTLKPETFEASQLLKSEKEADHREALVNASYSKLLDEVIGENPILSKLPHYGRYVTISQGLSQKDPSDPKSFAIYIDILSGFDQQGREEASKWFTDNSHDMGDYEIIYRQEQYQTRAD